MTQATINKYKRELMGLLKKDYLADYPDQPRSRDFNRIFRKMVASMGKEHGWELSRPNGVPYCECNAYIKRGDSCVWFCTDDYRWWPERLFDRILVRITKDENDSHGEGNQYTSLDHFEEMVNRLLDYADQRKNKGGN